MGRRRSRRGGRRSCRGEIGWERGRGKGRKAKEVKNHVGTIYALSECVFVRAHLFFNILLALLAGLPGLDNKQGATRGKCKRVNTTH
jgi:hypothetical protein